MSLTREEAIFVAEAMDSYPANVTPSSWGYGPLDEEDYLDEFDKETLCKYG